VISVAGAHGKRAGIGTMATMSFIAFALAVWLALAIRGG
jgi:hypothetical protein